MGNCCAQEASRATEATKQEAEHGVYAIDADNHRPVKATPDLHLEKASQASKLALNHQHEQSSEFTATSLPELFLPPDIENKLRQVYPSVSKRLREEMAPGNDIVGTRRSPGVTEMGPNEKYAGQMRGGLKDGYGKLLNDEFYYEGGFKRNLPTGYGILIHKNGDFYEGTRPSTGNLVDGKASGYGEFVTADATVYKGYWRDDKQNGQGEEVTADGSSYVGEFRDGVKSGQGKIIWSDGGIYEGGFLNGTLEGFGKYKWPDGREYEGGWKAGEMHGQGVFVWPDGRKYAGEYLNNKKNGLGVFSWKEGKAITCNWKEGIRSGEGTIRYPDGREIKKNFSKSDHEFNEK